MPRYDTPTFYGMLRCSRRERQGFLRLVPVIMKRVQTKLINSAVLLIFGFAVQSSNKCMAGEAMLLVQESPITGVQNIYITPKSIRIDNQKTGTTIVSKSPAWEVDLYNKRNRTSFHTTTGDFKASFFQGITKVYRENFTGLNWKKESTELHSGVPTIRYALHLNGKQGKLDLMSVPIQKADYWIATNFKLPAKVCNVLATLNSVPAMGAIPIQCTYTGVDGDSASPLATKVAKKISVVDPFFEIPKFAAATSERDVFIDPAGRVAIEGMFGDPPAGSK